MGGVSGVVQREALVVPADATTLDGFRRWRRGLGEDTPKVHFIDGDLWLDMSPQSFRSHLPVHGEINAVLHELAKRTDLGRYFPDGGWITNTPAGLSNEPDGFLVLWETFESGDARLAEESEVELEGRADMALEVVSATSVKKDARLEVKYAEAGVREYWKVDARGDAPVLRLLSLCGETYDEVAADADGFVASPVWGRAFRLRRITDRLGQVDYRLDVR